MHQGANGINLITDAADRNRITGLTGFDAIGPGRTVDELAITMAHAPLDQPDLYTAMRALISSYVAIFLRQKAEAEVLYELMPMRLAASVRTAGRAAKEHPTTLAALALLHRLDRIDPEFTAARCRRSAGFGAADRWQPSRHSRVFRRPV